ncbi:PREDICTED: uncharacterized protein LOC104822877 [Tarenaya hassleriana]|uniref:uncharacterized protein LOC104822877 n=1 Tax=Tarenaya hassleriana TaxID=28532 RepID=UPI00053C08FD|nr:PREDICTED: uncharacterized protein LOC104822877 [Tarenaya hassleriana]
MENDRDFALPDGAEGNADSTFAQYNTLSTLSFWLRDNRVIENTLRLIAFPWTLLDTALEWCYDLTPDSIHTWEQLEVQFMSKIFPPHRTQAALSGIHSFKQDHGESLYKAWRRYKGYQKSCPHHGLDKNYLINTFFRGLRMDTKTLIRASCGGSIQNKSFAELEDHIEMMAQEEDAPSEYSRDPPRECNDQTIQMVLEQLAVLNAKLEDSNRHSRTKHLMPTQEELGMYALDERVEGVNYVANNAYSNTYNPGWKNHPNLSYKSNNVENPVPNNFRASDNSNQRIPPSFAFQSRGPNQTSNYRAPGQSYINSTPPGNPESNPDMHTLLIQFIQNQEKTNQEFRAQFASIDAHFKIIDNHIAQLASASQRPSGSLPGKPETNPREHVNAITLRSGKQVDVEDRPMVERGKSSKTAVVDIHDDEPEPAYLPPPHKSPAVPFPSRLRKHNEDSQFAKFVEMPKKLELPLKQSDPGSFSIPCKLGNVSIDRAFCDLGADVSLLPLSIFKKLNVDELKPTRMTLQLADRSIKCPAGILEDAPLKVGNFYIPVDFVVLDMDEDSKVGERSIIFAS